MKNLKGSLEQNNVFAKLFILLGITLFCVILISPISLILQSQPDNMNAMKWVQLTMSVGVIAAPPLLLAYLISSKPATFLKFNTKTSFLEVIIVALLMIVAIPFINLVGDLNKQFVLPHSLAGIESLMKSSEIEATKFTEKLLNVHTLLGLLVNILVIAVAPAIGEELFFRGALQGVLKDWKGIRPAIWISAILFSTIHFQFYGFVPRMLMGASFGYLLVWSKNMWLPITAHFTNNAIAIIFYYLKLNGFRVPDIDVIGTGNTLWLGIASGLAASVSMYYLYRHFQKKSFN
jgi:membrane protease YdiL (CAAX protease family)